MCRWVRPRLRTKGISWGFGCAHPGGDHPADRTQRSAEQCVAPDGFSFPADPRADDRTDDGDADRPGPKFRRKQRLGAFLQKRVAPAPDRRVDLIERGEVAGHLCRRFGERGFDAAQRSSRPARNGVIDRRRDLRAGHRDAQRLRDLAHALADRRGRRFDRPCTFSTVHSGTTASCACTASSAAARSAISDVS